MSQASFAASTAYEFSRYAADDSIVAMRGQHRVRYNQFRQDIAALAERLPSHQYMVNLCTDRYKFMVGLGAALQRRQVSLMPPGNASAMLEILAADFPDLYALVDTARPKLPSLIYPDDFVAASTIPAPLLIPEDQPAIVLFTSGSTGRPKPVPKCWGPLVRSARAAGARLGIAGLPNACVIGTVPQAHSYGFESMVLLGLQHGLAIDTGLPLYPGDIRAAIERAARPRILVTAPVHLRALAAETDAMPPVDLIISATAPLQASLAASAEACFAAPLMEIYGCTEAGQLATRRTAQETEWHCLDGVSFDQDGDGIRASGSAVQGTAILHDMIEPTGPATFLLGGRSTDLVDVAGKRTSLAYLNHQLLSVDGVQDGVFLMEEAEGQRVARPMALVVAPGLQAATILLALRARIDAAFLPRPLVLVDELPRNALGKMPREALLRLSRQGWGT